MLDILNPMRITYRLISTAGEALRASGGTVHLLKDGQRELVHTYGGWAGNAVIEVPLEHDGHQPGSLAFGPPRSGCTYSSEQRQITRWCAQRVAEALATHARLQ